MADFYVNNGKLSLLFLRRYSTFFGLIIPALLIVAFSYVTHLYSAIMYVLFHGKCVIFISLITLSMGVLSLNAVGHLSNHADVCPRFAGISFAISNTIVSVL